jgi:hypothetical protein
VLGFIEGFKLDDGEGCTLGNNIGWDDGDTVGSVLEGFLFCFSVKNFIMKSNIFIL